MGPSQSPSDPARVARAWFVGRMEHEASTGSVVLSEESRGRLAEFVAVHGEARVCEALGTNRQTLARALGGLGIRRASAAFLGAGVQRLASM